MSIDLVLPRAGSREWIGLAVLTLPCLLISMDLTVLYLAVPHLSADLKPSARRRWAAARARLKLDSTSFKQRIGNGWNPASASADEREALLSLASIYLIALSPTPSGDAVAKFHLGNGARLQRINWAADLSKNGLRQSCGLMVNYLYDLDRVEDYHERFLGGDVVHAQSVARQS